MSVVSVQPRSFILALFIRDDDERFLLGDNGYDFKDSQLHFVANTIENDEVMKQGADGVMLAGQVRRSSVQSFDGYIGDATKTKEAVEQMRRDFIAFFAKGHHFRVIYVDCNRNAWQRKGGYLVDAPEVKELWQIHPEYHVGLNFEDVNYYSYDEDSAGEEILANIVSIPVSVDVEGGLVWDEDGAVSEDAEVEYDEETADATPAKNVHITDATEAPLASFQLDGETSQNGTPTPSAPVAVNTTTGENVVKICGKNLFETPASATNNGITFTLNSDGTYNISGTATAQANDIVFVDSNIFVNGATYTLSANQPLPNGIRILVEAYNGSTWLRHALGNNAFLDATRQSITAAMNTTGSNRIRLTLHVDNGATVNISGLGIQLELGSTATDYEPYQGQSYEINLGKNLFDKDASQYLYGYFDGSTPQITAASSDGRNGVVYLPCEPSTTYTIGAQSITADIRAISTTATTPEVGTAVPREIGSGFNAVTITTPSNARYIVIRYRVNSGLIIADTISSFMASLQVEKGSQATSYAAYFEPIELCGIGDDGAGGYLYKNRIYKNLTNNKWYVHKAVGKLTLTGGDSEGWSLTGTNVFATTNGAITGSAYPPLALCRYATFNPVQFSVTGALANGEFAVQYNNGNNSRVFFKNTAISDVSDFVAWVSENTPTIYYALATPTDTEITNEALVAQLEALLNTARTYAGINNIFTITQNEQGTMEISYYTKYQPMAVEGGYVWEAGGAGGPTTVVNNSIGSVNPVWTVYGPTIDPQLENTTTGEIIEYVGTISSGQKLTIDMGEQTASLDGLNVISNVVGDYISLAPGQNQLIYSVSGEAGASELGWSEIVG